jgi:hypothetical protein
MNRILPFTLLVLTTAASADDQSVRAAVGGGLGGAAGAYVGSELGGRSGAIVGGAVGAAAGTALATEPTQPQGRVVYPAYPPPPPVHYGPSHPSRFCPPGQAKKGRC